MGALRFIAADAHGCAWAPSGSANGSPGVQAGIGFWKMICTGCGEGASGRRSLRQVLAVEFILPACAFKQAL